MRFLYYILLLFTITGYSQNIIIGDSQVAFLDIHITKAQRVNSLWKPGITANDLTRMVQNYPLSTTVRNVIISIGTNDGYKGDVTALYKILKYRFPYAKFYAVPGSWNWGGLRRITLKDVNTYYMKHASQGAFVIPLAIGPGDPHQYKQSYVLIGSYLDEILTNN
jgi:hypothetical protein